MTEKQQHMCEALMDMQLPEAEARWLQRVIINNPEMDEAEDYHLKELFNDEFGYGMEE